MDSEKSLSILLPFRDAANTLAECFQSIARQTFGGFEIIAIDDHSTDGSTELVRKLARSDDRIRLIPNKEQGLVPALNLGLKLAHSSLVARMDADDLMHPQRLRMQYDYLQQHPRCDLVSCQVRGIPEDGIGAGYTAYLQWQNSCLNHQDIANEIYWESPLAHPSVMFRKDVVLKLGGYGDGMFPEDYDLWLRMIQAGCLFHKLDSVLLDWRDHGLRASRTQDRYSRSAFDRLRAKFLAQDPRLQQGRPLVIWGAGLKTRKRTRLLLECGYTATAWVDIDPRKMGNRIADAPVISPEAAKDIADAFVLSYVTNHGARELIARQLQAMGMERGQDYLMVG